MKAISFLTLCFLVSCAHKPRKTFLPDGREGYTSKCYYNSAKCYNRAATFCAGPYEVISLTTNKDKEDEDYSTITYACKR